VAYNLYLIDTTLVAAIQREEAAWADAQLRELGELLGTEDAQRWGFEANENEPVLHTHDRFGNRRDEVVFHPSWHHLMRTSVEHQIDSLPWIEPRQGAHVARSLLMLTAQNELGHTCLSWRSRRKEHVCPTLALPHRQTSRARPPRRLALHLDLVAVARDQLRAAGVQASNIEVADFCTACHTDLFFSHRKEGHTGRAMAVIGIRRD